MTWMCRLTLVCLMSIGPIAAGLADDAQNTGLDEIVVSAQRRDESLQNVPIAVVALTSNTLTQMGVTRSDELLSAVPGLDFSRQADGATIFIRGVGNPNGGVGQESSVALYIDGVYLPSPIGAMFSFNNIDRVEVLKGPQGTLFGRNATGGVIQVITKDPSSIASAEGTVSYANYEAIESTFYGTTGVTGNLATDLAVYGYNRAQGWGTYTFLDREAFKGSEWDVRNKWLWTPGDSTEVRLAIDAGEVKTLEGIGWHQLPGAKGLDGSVYNGHFYDQPDDFPTGAVDRYGGASLSFKQDTGIGKFVSTTAYRGIKGYYQIDQDATPTVIFDNYVSQPERTFTQELQLLSATTDRLQWIIGAFFYHDDSKFDPIRLTGPGFMPLGVFNIRDEQTTTSYAGYAQGTAEIAQSTNFTAGLRYTDDRRGVVGSQEAPGVGVVNTGGGHASFSKLTWRLALDHKFTPATMGYVSYNRGFKAGLFNLGSYNDPAAKPEILDAYEIGLKSELFDRKLRLNAASFYYNYKDLQVAVPFPGGESVYNAATARMYGLDLDVTARATEHLTLQGGLNYTHSRYTSFPLGPILTPLPAGGAATASGDLTGNTPVHAPKFTSVVGANYRYDTDIGAVDLSATYSYNDGFFWYPDNIERQPVTNIVNASIGWTARSGHWGISLWGKNLLSEEYYSQVSESSLGYAGSPAPPRTFGVTFKMNSL
jgi:iron complex outermembrane receptor protein